LLTCHWHHARFDLASGGTLNPFADDVKTFPVVLDGSEVSVESVADDDDWAARGLARLQRGLETQLPLVLAKSTLALLGRGLDIREVLRLVARFGARYRAAGWGTGLTTLTAMANVLPILDTEERTLALFHGALRVDEDCAGRAPRFGLAPLPARSVSPARLGAWFREAVEVRDEDAAERALATAIDGGMSERAVADMLFAATTDHYFIDGGHTLDFVGRAFELLEHLGWSEAPAILPTLVRGLCRATRSEELGAWGHPLDLHALLMPALERLPTIVGVQPPRGERLSNANFDDLVATLLGEAPDVSVRALTDALTARVALVELGQAVAHAAALRIPRFPTANDFGDWEAVHNTFTSCHALHQALGRAPSRELARARSSRWPDSPLHTCPRRAPSSRPIESRSGSSGERT